MTKYCGQDPACGSRVLLITNHHEHGSSDTLNHYTESLSIILLPVIICFRAFLPTISVDIYLDMFCVKFSRDVPDILSK